MSDQPLISVLISVYNDALYLGPAIRSILSQSLEDFEIVIVDDGSTDGTAEVIRSFDDPRIRSVHHENRGLVPSLNRGLDLCRGKYVARLDGDDTSRPDRLARQLEFLDTDPNRVVVGSWVTVHGLDGSQIDDLRSPSNDVELRWDLLWGIVYPHSSLLIRTKSLREIGGWDETFWREYPHASDYDLIVRLGQLGEIGCIPEFLLRWQYDTEDGISVKNAVEQGKTSRAIGRRQLNTLLGVEVPKEVAGAAWTLVNDPKRLDPSLASVATSIVISAVKTYRTQHPGGLATRCTESWLREVAEGVFDDAGRTREQQLVALRTSRRLAPGRLGPRGAGKAAIRALVGSRLGDRLVGRS